MRLQDHFMDGWSFKTMLGGAATGVFGFLASINWIGLLGALAAVIGLLANVYFAHRRDRREQMESEARMRALESRAPCRKTDFPGTNLDGWDR